MYDVSQVITMKLPNAAQAIVDPRKIHDYCLSVSHSRGRHKARVFASALGLTAKDTDEFVDVLRKAVLRYDAVEGESDEFGDRYTVDFPLERNGRTAKIRSCWIVLRAEQTPRFVTCFVFGEEG